MGRKCYDVVAKPLAFLSHSVLCVDQGRCGGGSNGISVAPNNFNCSLISDINETAMNYNELDQREGGLEKGLSSCSHVVWYNQRCFL